MIQALLLAAGHSRRFGSDKLLHTLPNGKLLIEQSLKNLQTVTGNITVVIRPQQTQLHEWLQQQNISICLCPEAEHGMGHSIACGVGYSLNADGWMICLADMPTLQAETIQAIYNGLLQGHDICRPRYQGHDGHPVGISRKYKTELQSLREDKGAREILSANSITLINVDDPGCILDIDTIHDIDHLDTMR